MRPAAMAFWGRSRRSLSIEFRVAAIPADEGLELREHGERPGRDMSHGQRPTSGPDALEEFDCGGPAFGTRTSRFHDHRSGRPEEKAWLGFPDLDIRTTSSVGPRTACGISRLSARRRRDNILRSDSCGSNPGVTPPRDRTR